VGAGLAVAPPSTPINRASYLRTQDQITRLFQLSLGDLHVPASTPSSPRHLRYGAINLRAGVCGGPAPTLDEAG
jgi:hypothetical protein